MTKTLDLATLGSKEALTGIAINCVILGFHEGEVKVLLSKIEKYEKWLLPMSFVPKEESVDDTARSVLKKRTGLSNTNLRQFHLFGGHARSGLKDKGELLSSLKLDPSDVDWCMQRFVSVGYYALVKYHEVSIQKIFPEHHLAWHSIDNLPKMFGDHADIIQKARSTIKYQIGYLPIGYELLPEKFTMPELRMIYEIFIQKELDRRNFQRKMLSVGFIFRLNETRKVGNHKSPRLYSFQKEKYDMVQELGIQIMSWMI